ncbi:MAG: gluconeogenesis factor YvcK family protein [Anaerolineae bacterium]
MINKHRKLQRGTKVVAIGGGTGLPSVLKGLKVFTSNITTVVTVADDGGSSGRLRRDLGVLPPGDLRNNIAALADDENLMTQLFQYRFQDGDLGGHAFGNLFISALAGVTGSLEAALIETERVLNIAGRVYPATLEDVNLSAQIRLNGTRRTVLGESKITAAGGQIEELSLVPPDVGAYQGSVQAILDADIVVIGPGSLFTSILPNLLVQGSPTRCERPAPTRFTSAISPRSPARRPAIPSPTTCWRWKSTSGAASFRSCWRTTPTRPRTRASTPVTCSPRRKITKSCSATSSGMSIWSTPSAPGGMTRASWSNRS